MGGILKSGSTAKQPTVVSSLQFQTAAKGAPIPLVYGTVRIAPNLIQYDDFQSHAVKPGGGKGKGGGGGKSGQSSSSTYSASMIFGLCQGPIQNIGAIWANKNVGGLDPTLATLHLGTDGQAADSFWQSAHASTALGYSGTAYLSLPNFNLGTSAAAPNITVEIISPSAGGGCTNYDANPADIVSDFLTNPRYGANFPAANLSDLTGYHTYCQAARIGLSPQLDTQQEAQQSLGDIVKITNSAIVWSGGTLKIIPYGDIHLTTSFTMVSLPNGGAVSLTFTNALLAGLPVTVSATPSDTFLSSQALTDAVNQSTTLAGLGITARGTSFGRVLVIVFADTRAIGTVITASAGTVAATNTFDYVPNTTPIYSLGEDDFIVQESSVGSSMGVSPGGAALRSGGSPVTGGFQDNPLHIARSTPADAMNMIQIEYLDRNFHYNTEIAEAFDQAAIDLYGVRRNTSVQARGICDGATASLVAQLMLQRSLLFRNTYTFRLGWKYCLLEPMDLVQITDARLGASALTVRITAVEEDEEGMLTITAEDFLAGASTAVLYPKQTSSGYVPNYNSAPGPVNPPIIFEPPTSIATNEIWIALSGGTNWGSAQVWISSDGTSYAALGVVGATATMGVTTAVLPVGASTDNTNTLRVDLTESRGVLNSVSATDAANLVTLSYLSGPAHSEFVAYQTATLTAASKYNLTTLYRGTYGTTIESHPLPSNYVLINGAVGRFPYPSNLTGQTIFLKFVSSNPVGGGTENLSSVVPYSYTLLGGP